MAKLDKTAKNQIKNIKFAVREAGVDAFRVTEFLSNPSQSMKAVLSNLKRLELGLNGLWDVPELKSLWCEDRSSLKVLALAEYLTILLWQCDGEEDYEFEYDSVANSKTSIFQRFLKGCTFPQLRNFLWEGTALRLQKVEVFAED